MLVAVLAVAVRIRAAYLTLVSSERVNLAGWLRRRAASAATGPPIEVVGLSKSYHGRPAVDAIDLTVLPGEVYGFLGPNGAGKTTTMRMLLGLVAPDEGSIRLFGRDPRTDALGARAGVAGIIEEPRLYTYLSGRTNLRLLAAYDRSGVDRAAVEEMLETVELRERGGDRVAEYSQGMRQRLGIAACLVRRPRLLLLDEPANGLDPAGIRYLRGLVRRLSGEGMTVFLSSHLLRPPAQPSSAPSGSPPPSRSLR